MSRRVKENHSCGRVLSSACLSFSFATAETPRKDQIDNIQNDVTSLKQLNLSRASVAALSQLRTRHYDVMSAQSS